MPALRLSAVRVMLNPSVTAGRAVAAQEHAVIGGPETALRAFLAVMQG